MAQRADPNPPQCREQVASVIVTAPTQERPVFKDATTVKAYTLGFQL